MNSNGRKKVFITRMIPKEAINLLRLHFEVRVNEEGRNHTKEELISNIKDCHGVLCMLTDGIDKEVFECCSNVEVFANYAVGYNNIDVEEAKQRGIAVTNTPGVLTNATGDMAWALLFSASRRIVESDKFTRDGHFKEWTPSLFLGQEITGKTLGVIGAGRIGKAFARKSIGFDMKVLYHNRKRDEEFETAVNATYVDLDTLCRESDFISIHVPLTEETRHLIGVKELGLMKKNAVIINTSRGPVIDEKALTKALKEEAIFAAGLDVYEEEPFIEEELLKLQNVVLAPHIGSATVDTRNKMALMAAHNIIEVLSGNKPLNSVY